MKQLDWKSFAIGVLLTTTVMFGTGSATSTNEKWDSNQKWEYSTKNGKAGYEPFFVDDGIVYWRKRIQ
jgi:hypothetical protein